MTGMELSTKEKRQLRYKIRDLKTRLWYYEKKCREIMQQIDVCRETLLRGK
jgi:hypothetical protein